MDKRTLTVPNVEGRLRDFYKHSEDPMVSVMQLLIYMRLNAQDLVTLHPDVRQ